MSVCMVAFPVLQVSCSLTFGIILKGVQSHSRQQSRDLTLKQSPKTDAISSGLANDWQTGLLCGRPSVVVESLLAFGHIILSMLLQRLCGTLIVHAIVYVWHYTTIEVFFVANQTCLNMVTPCTFTNGASYIELEKHVWFGCVFTGLA